MARAEHNLYVWKWTGIAKALGKWHGTFWALCERFEISIPKHRGSKFLPLRHLPEIARRLERDRILRRLPNERALKNTILRAFRRKVT